MPIYEYQAVADGCEHCRNRFEERQSIHDKPLRVCPRCGKAVRKLFSRSFISVEESLGEAERLVKYTPEEAEDRGLSGGFAEDRVYE